MSMQDILPYRLPRLKEKKLLDPHVAVIGAGASVAACRKDKVGREVPLLRNIHHLLGLTKELEASIEEIPEAGEQHPALRWPDREAMCRMSITEGMCHALFAALAVVILGLPISMAVCAEVSKKSFAGAVVPYQFPFLQMVLFLLALFGMEVVLSVWMVRRQKKQSLVEKMRAQS